MEETKAPDASPSEEWAELPWRKLEQHLYRLQKRIFKASERGDLKTVHKLQKLLMKSRSARLLAVRRVTQDNQGKKTAGIDGVKSVQPSGRFAMAEAIHPKQMSKRKPQPLRRVWIPKPEKTEQRPLGIPVMFDRACQALAKAALEPQWEAKFEANSYGFRPGRGAHDAVGAIFNNIRLKSKYVLDADIKGCFDNINHQALLEKLHTYPAMRRLVKGWLKAGVMEALELSPTKTGTPQGGVVSPLLANIALYGMEEALLKAYIGENKAPSALRGAPQLIRYADDFVVLHAEVAEVMKAQQIIATWLKGIGLELKPSKTRLSHTLKDYQGNVGFHFLGFTIRQFPVGKTHTGKGKPSGFKTIITPSKEGVQRHLQELRKILQKGQSLPQEELIDQLNPVIYGWALYYRTVVSAKQFATCDHHLVSMLWQKMAQRHPKKSAKWVKEKYWRTGEGNAWTFATSDDSRLRTLRWHAATPIQRHTKVKGKASPFDGNLLYWAKRLKDHPLTKTTLGKLLQKQQGKCRWCGLLFREEDHIEIDHITPKSEAAVRNSATSLPFIAIVTTKGTRNMERSVSMTTDRSIEEPCEVTNLTHGFEAERRGRPLRLGNRLYEVLQALGLPIEVGTGGRTRWNRARLALPKTHWIDAAAVGASTPERLRTEHVRPWLIEAKGRQHRQMVNRDDHGFPRGKSKGPSCVHGFKTGDLVRAVVTRGKKIGKYQGRVAIKTDGYFKLTGRPFGMVEGIHARYCTPIHRKDGYAYV